MVKVIKLSRQYDARFENLYTFQSKTSNVTDNIYIYMSIMETKCCPNKSKSVNSDHLWDELQVNFF